MELQIISAHVILTNGHLVVILNVGRNIEDYLWYGCLDSLGDLSTSPTG